MQYDADSKEKSLIHAHLRDKASKEMSHFAGALIPGKLCVKMAQQEISCCAIKLNQGDIAGKGNPQQGLGFCV